MKRNAIIIAAGTSSRFVPLSFEKPKGLVEVKGEVLIERQIRQLREAGVTDICIVVGYMAEQFAYLKERYGVQMMLNEDYAKYNNVSSVIRVLDKLDNTHFCCSDQYYAHNPFLEQPNESAYAALYADGKTNEYCLRLNDNNQIQEVAIGGADAWYMAGYAYFNSEFSRQYKRLLTEAYADESKRQLYWEDIYIEHLHELPLMRAIKMADDELYEFDSLDELRLFDKTYLADTRSIIVKQICRQLQCQEEDLHTFRKVANGVGETFAFMRKDVKYQYTNGEITKC